MSSGGTLHGFNMEGILSRTQDGGEWERACCSIEEGQGALDTAAPMDRRLVGEGAACQKELALLHFRSLFAMKFRSERNFAESALGRGIASCVKN